MASEIVDSVLSQQSRGYFPYDCPCFLHSNIFIKSINNIQLDQHFEYESDDTFYDKYGEALNQRGLKSSGKSFQSSIPLNQIHFQMSSSWYIVYPAKLPVARTKWINLVLGKALFETPIHLVIVRCCTSYFILLAFHSYSVVVGIYIRRIVFRPKFFVNGGLGQKCSQ